MNNSPVGIFDSGVGGLSVWLQVRKLLPEESILYFGDGKNCPYGDRPQAEVIAFAERAVSCLLREGAKLIVVACNAATAAAIERLRSVYTVPFVGMEPAVKPAAETTRTGVVGVLATRAALTGRLFARTVARYGGGARIISAVGEGFVELVESGAEHLPEALEAVRAAVEPLLARNADRIVLGCTHYPFLASRIREVIGDRDVMIVDPAPAVARRTAELLDLFEMRAAHGNVPYYEFLTAADEDYRERLIEKAARISGGTAGLPKF